MGWLELGVGYRASGARGPGLVDHSKWAWRVCVFPILGNVHGHSPCGRCCGTFTCIRGYRSNARGTQNTSLTRCFWCRRSCGVITQIARTTKYDLPWRTPPKTSTIRAAIVPEAAISGSATDLSRPRRRWTFSGSIPAAAGVGDGMPISGDATSSNEVSANSMYGVHVRNSYLPQQASFLRSTSGTPLPSA